MNEEMLIVYRQVLGNLDRMGNDCEERAGTMLANHQYHDANARMAAAMAYQAAYSMIRSMLGDPYDIAAENRRRAS